MSFSIKVICSEQFGVVSLVKEIKKRFCNKNIIKSYEKRRATKSALERESANNLYKLVRGSNMNATGQISYLKLRFARNALMNRKEGFASSSLILNMFKSMQSSVVNISIKNATTGMYQS